MLFATTRLLLSVIVPVSPAVNVIVSPLAVALIASRSEQSLLHTPSFVSASLVTTSVFGSGVGVIVFEITLPNAGPIKPRITSITTGKAIVATTYSRVVAFSGRGTKYIAATP